MSSVIRVKRRLTGGSGAPAVGVEGEVALNFSAGSTVTPELWAHGGPAGWLRVNPATVTQSLVFGTAGADVGAAYTAWAAVPGNALTGDVVVASWGTPTQAYVLTNKAAAGAAASWTPLGGAVDYATSAEVITGTEALKSLSPKNLADASVNGGVAPVVADAGKYVRVDANGKISPALLPVDPINLKGAIAPTAAAPTTPTKGDSYFLNAAGVFPASWTGIATQNGKIGDRVIYDGAAWHLIPNSVDLASYLPLAGGTMADTARVTFAVPAAAATTPAARIDGGDATKSALDNFTVDAGTY